MNYLLGAAYFLATFEISPQSNLGNNILGRPKVTMPVDTPPSSTSTPAKTRPLRARSSHRPIEQLTERSFKDFIESRKEEADNR